MSMVFPLSPLWFRKRRVFRSVAFFQSMVQEALGRDPRLAASRSVSVDVTVSGVFSLPRLRLRGSVEDESLKWKAEELAGSLAEGTVEIVNDLRIGPAAPRASGARGRTA